MKKLLDILMLAFLEASSLLWADEDALCSVG